MPICPCSCGSISTRLFAPGHDARYKGVLKRAHASDSLVKWHTGGPDAYVWVPTEEAVDRIAAAIGSDWSPIFSGGSPRRLTPSSAPRRAPAPPSASVTPPEPVATPSASSAAPPTPCQDRRASRSAHRQSRRDPVARSARIDGLMDRLTSRGPVVGQWGWYRPSAAPDTRFAAQVRRTRRDSGDFTLDLFVPDGIRPGEDARVTGVDSSTFFVDHMAKP